MAVEQIGFAQKGHIYETHSAKEETEQEHVAGVSGFWLIGQVQILNAFDVGKWKRPFNSLADSCVDIAKRIALPGYAIGYGTVVDGAEYTHVERRSVWPDTSFS